MYICLRACSAVFFTYLPAESNVIGARNHTRISRKSPTLFMRVNWERYLLVGGLNPSEKYESISMTIPKLWKNKSHVPVTTNQYEYLLFRHTLFFETTVLSSWIRWILFLDLWHGVCAAWGFLANLPVWPCGCGNSPAIGGVHQWGYPNSEKSSMAEKPMNGWDDSGVSSF